MAHLKLLHFTFAYVAKKAQWETTQIPSHMEFLQKKPRTIISPSREQLTQQEMFSSQFPTFPFTVFVFFFQICFV